MRTVIQYILIYCLINITKYIFNFYGPQVFTMASLQITFLPIPLE